MNTLKAGLLLLALIFAWTSPAQPQAGRKATPDESLLVGDWRGESMCVVRESACHDEDSLYHIAKLPEKPGWFAMKADKIVDGKPVTMGTSECSYNATKQSLECVLPKAVIRFTVTGKTMQGTMTLADNTLWRKISLKKVGS